MLSIIIPVVEIGSKMKSCGPKSLLKIKNECLIDRQIKIIEKVFKKIDKEIIVVFGSSYDKIHKKLPISIMAIFNENYLNTNVVYSLKLAFDKKNGDSVFIIYGNTIFNEQAINFKLDKTKAIIYHNNKIDSVGVNHLNNTINRFAYGLDYKWGQILYLQEPVLGIFKKEINNIKNKKKFCFEILNNIIDAGYKIYPEIINNKYILEIDTQKDFKKANESIYL